MHTESRWATRTNSAGQQNKILPNEFLLVGDWSLTFLAIVSDRKSSVIAPSMTCLGEHDISQLHREATILRHRYTDLQTDKQLPNVKGNKLHSGKDWSIKPFYNTTERH